MSNLDNRAPIVVGVDGSASGNDALDWAVAEASDTQRPLRIVHVLDVRALDAPRSQPASDQVVHDTRCDRTGETDYHAGGPTTVLARAALRARMAAPDLEIISTAVIGATVTALVGQAEGAELLVVGNHGHGSHGVRASRRGQSVAFAVTARAFCPVVVVRAWHEGDPDEVFGAGLGGATGALGGAEGDRVVVASDGSTWAAAATRFAFEVAARRRMRLSVLRAWTPPFAGYPRMVLGLQQLERAQRQQLLADLSAEQSEFPDVEVELMLVRDKHNHHGRALIEESAIATLVVLGSHVHSKFPGLLTDATCKAVLEQARCPVAVVKPQPSTTPIPMQPHVEPRVERPAQRLGQPAGELAAARSMEASVSLELPSEGGASGNRDFAENFEEVEPEDLAEDADHDSVSNRTLPTSTTSSAAGEVTDVLRWLHSNS